MIKVNSLVQVTNIKEYILSSLFSSNKPEDSLVGRIGKVVEINVENKYEDEEVPYIKVDFGNTYSWFYPEELVTIVN